MAALYPCFFAPIQSSLVHKLCGSSKFCTLKKIFQVDPPRKSFVPFENCSRSYIMPYVILPWALLLNLILNFLHCTPVFLFDYNHRVLSNHGCHQCPALWIRFFKFIHHGDFFQNKIHSNLFKFILGITAYDIWFVNTKSLRLEWHISPSFWDLPIEATFHHI